MSHASCCPGFLGSKFAHAACAKNACVFSLHTRWLNFLRVLGIFDPQKIDFAHAACCDSGFVVLFAHAACCDSGFAIWRSTPSNPTARLTTFSNTP